MRAKLGYKLRKADSPRIGRWLKRYFAKRTCRTDVMAKDGSCYACSAEITSGEAHDKNCPVHILQGILNAR